MDAITLKVMRKVYRRMADGEKEHGGPLSQAKGKSERWLREAQEELIDAVCYLERLLCEEPESKS